MSSVSLVDEIEFDEWQEPLAPTRKRNYDNDDGYDYDYDYDDWDDGSSFEDETDLLFWEDTISSLVKPKALEQLAPGT